MRSFSNIFLLPERGNALGNPDLFSSVAAAGWSLRSITIVRAGAFDDCAARRSTPFGQYTTVPGMGATEIQIEFDAGRSIAAGTPLVHARSQTLARWLSMIGRAPSSVRKSFVLGRSR